MWTYLKGICSFVILILLLIGAFKLFNMAKEGYSHVKMHGLRSVIENIMDGEQPDSLSKE